MASQLWGPIRAAAAAAGDAALSGAGEAAVEAAGCAAIDPAFAAAMTGAVAQALAELRVAPEEDLQRERFKLFDQEYQYYRAANSSLLPAVPDASDGSGGLSNRTYLNFVSYIGWKVVARRVLEPGQRAALCRRVGELLLPLAAPGEVEALRREAAASPGGVVSEASAAAAAARLMGRLRDVGYVCGWQIVWGDTPGGWPPDWYAREPGLVGDVPAAAAAAPGSSGGGSGGSGVVEAAAAPGQALFQVKLLQPADIQASVALRQEDSGFWGRHVSSLLAALLAEGGWQAGASEYFYQDDWSGPATLGGKLLLLLGDPLQSVDIPWTPTTLVQDWAAAPSPVGRAGPAAAPALVSEL